MKRNILKYAIAVACILLLGMTCHGKVSVSANTSQGESTEASSQARFTRYEWKSGGNEYRIEIYNDNTFKLSHSYQGHYFGNWEGKVSSSNGSNIKKFDLGDASITNSLYIAGRNGGSNNRQVFFGYYDSNNKCYYFAWYQSDINNRTNLQKATWDPYQ